MISGTKLGSYEVVALIGAGAWARYLQLRGVERGFFYGSSPTVRDWATAIPNRGEGLPRSVSDNARVGLLRADAVIPRRCGCSRSLSPVRTDGSCDEKGWSRGETKFACLAATTDSRGKRLNIPSGPTF
jgi:hypothetical protein